MTEAEQYADRISDLQAELQVQFRLKGFDWRHPRVKAWMGKAGLRNPVDFDPEHYEALIKQLRLLPNQISEAGVPSPALWRYQAELVTAIALPNSEQVANACIASAEALESTMDEYEIERDRMKWACMPRRGESHDVVLARFDSWVNYGATTPNKLVQQEPEVKPLPKPVPYAIQEIVERCSKRSA